LQRYRVRGTALLEAEQDLEAAIARDPGYARAHALLATVLLVQPFYVQVRARDLEPRVLAAATRAIQLDDALAEGHLALGFAYVVANVWDKAEDEYKRAIALDPRSVDAHFRLGQLYQITGRIQESLAPLEVASRLDPLYPTPLSNLGLSQGMVGRTAEGLATLRRALALDAGLVPTRSMLAGALLAAGRAPEAAAEARLLLASSSDPARIGVAAAVLAGAGESTEARQLLRRLEALPPDAIGRDLGLVYARLGLGDIDGALDASEAAVETNLFEMLVYGLAFPVLDPLRESPRFAAILRRLNLDVARLTLPDAGRSR
jgi:serine/threonine-protein kinase